MSSSIVQSVLRVVAGKLPRLRERLGIFDAHVHLQLALAVHVDALDELHLFAVRHRDSVDPSAVVEVVALDHERLAFPVADRVAHPRGREVRAVLAAVGVDLPNQMIVLEHHLHAPRRLDDLHRERVQVDPRRAGRVALVDEVVGLRDRDAARPALRLRRVEARLPPLGQCGQLLAERVDRPIRRAGQVHVRPDALEIGAVLQRLRRFLSRTE